MGVESLLKQSIMNVIKANSNNPDLIKEEIKKVLQEYRQQSLITLNL